MGKSYDNTIITAEVSLAIEALLIGNSTLTWDPSTGKINMDTPPTGFTRLGAVVEDSPTLTIRRDKFMLKLGVPKALQFEAVIGVDGEFSCTIYGKSNDVAKYAFGTDIVSLSTFGTRIAFGKTTLNKYALLGVADFTDGTQVVHYFKEVSIKPEVSENLRPDDVGKIPMGFDCYSHISTIHGSERIVGERVYFK